MAGTAVRPFLSGLLIGAELLGAAELYDLSQPVRLIADGMLGEAYSAALAARGIPASRIEPNPFCPAPRSPCFARAQPVP